ncbi:lysophospholipid acyltransferase family protein|uniref:KDO2-lipid IV(A) lauroyltransferase n=1 Tax=Dendrosporobacter quercicolus TaxID=146817 RepID=A0A1G9R5B6_9FIRM|nr:lysophospholipid acyltransferase family protein [Dendrosporobacter quercicolus]NSL48482.1 lysophospholipid acyltransferase family protein [Dendrosporobacter quercicolus DSM 1736]SDM18300.1 KDO2-lipid IV(A) lauroyltransferase [Dendrosporobacter quercicolus]
MLYGIARLCSAIVCILPKRIRRLLGTLLGELCWLLVPAKRKRMAVENVRQGLLVSSGEARVIVKQSTVRFGRMLLEVLAFPAIKREVHRYIHFIGTDHLTEALSYGRGVILATAHSGNWELLGAALALNHFPLCAVAQKQTNAGMDRLINDYRALVGMHVTYKKGVREMIKMLSEGKIIGMLMDQDAGRDGVFVDFFNREASTPRGPAYLARLKEAPIIPAFITENADSTHTVILQQPIWPRVTGQREQDILATTQQLTHIIERHIRVQPAEWFWLHNRWKTTP